MQTLTLGRLAQPLIDFLFPPLCLSCEDRLGDTERFLCARCRQALERVHADDRTMRVLGDRFRRTGVVDGFTALYYFEEHGVLQPVIHALKYRGMTSVGESFGLELGAHLAAHPDFSGIRFILPLPLHAQKQRERGYNQSEIICRGVARRLGVPVERRMLFRRKNTRSQTKLSAAERTRNVAGAFAVEPAALIRLQKASVLVIDDVVTTGATIHECAETLRRAGAARVLCASIGAAKLDHAGPEGV